LALALRPLLRCPPPSSSTEQPARTLLGRLATPEEIGLAVLVAAIGLSHSTGVVLPIDGGRALA